MQVTNLTNHLTISVLLLVTLCTASMGRNIYINDDASGDYPTIQAAIDAATDGDTIILQPGTYTGDGNRDIDFKGKAITVRSTEPNDPNIVEATVIDCNASKDEPHRGFYFHSREGPDSIIFGFTIKNGYIFVDANDRNAYGGGIYCKSSSPTIHNCVLVDSNAYGAPGDYDLDYPGGEACGGGIYCNNSSATIISCIIKNNTTTGGEGFFSISCGDAFGAGIYCNQSSVTIQNCIVTNNRAEGGGGRWGGPGDACGGGIFCTSNSNPIIIDCIISDNLAVAGLEGPDIGCFWMGYALGGGIHCNSGSNAIIDNCVVSNNIVNGGDWEGSTCKSGGGGICCTGSSPAITGCIIADNVSYSLGSVPNAEAIYGGGILCVSGSNPKIIDCNIYNNMAIGSKGAKRHEGDDIGYAGGSGYGGGIYCDSLSNATLEQCVIAGNTVSGGNAAKAWHTKSGGLACGGGICYESSNRLSIQNCAIVGNIAAGGNGGNCSMPDGGDGGDGGDGYGGGIYCAAFRKPTIVNCTVSTNEVFAGEGGSGYYDGFLGVYLGVDGADGNTYGAGIYCEPNNIGIITNCIVWGNDGADEISDSNSIITYSNIEGGWPGEGNIDADPCFVSPGYWVDVNDPNITVKPNDPNAVWIDGDYHLKSQTGRLDLDSESWVRDDVTSPCIDAGDPASPVGLEPFPNGGIVNMGAYGGTAEASKSYFGEPVCETIVAGDINGDCKVDFSDLAIMALHWFEESLP